MFGSITTPLIPAILATATAWSLRHAKPPLWLILPALFMPDLLLGHALSAWFLPFAGTPHAWWCYEATLALKLLAPAFLLISFFPEPSHAAGFLWRQHTATSKQKRQHLCFTTVSLLPTLCLLYTLAWQDFELASRLGVRTWTVRLFDAHAGGLLLSKSWQLAIAPMLGTGFLLLITWGIVKRTPRLPRNLQPHKRVLFPIAALLLLAPLLPTLRLIPASLGGWEKMINHPPLLREMFASICTGIASGGTAWLLSSTRKWWHWPFAGVGLIGALPLGLTLLTLFQLPGFLWLRDTPIPLVLGLTIRLFPFALLLRYVLIGDKNPARFLAASARSRRALWPLQTAPAALGCYLLILAGSLELTLSHLLAPPAWATAAPRLYNLMHYGESQVLHAMILTVYLAPLALLPLWFGAVWWRSGTRPHD